jgi:hypothetical protein
MVHFKQLELAFGLSSQQYKNIRDPCILLLNYIMIDGGARSMNY